MDTAKKINALAYDRLSHKIYTSDLDANVIEWNVDGGHTAHFEGNPHGGSVRKLAISNGNLFSVSLDDTLKTSSLSNKEFGNSVPLEGQPVDVIGYGNIAYVVTTNKFIAIENNEIVASQDLNFEATCLAIHPDGNEISIGGKDKIIHVYNRNGHALTSKYNLNDTPGAITCLDYSSDGVYLASGDASRQVRCWQGQTVKCKMWVFHTTSVTSIAWCPDNKHVVTGSIDTNVIVWSLDKPLKRIVIQGAHYGGVSGVTWLDANTVASVGDDCCLKTWTITKHS